MRIAVDLRTLLAPFESGVSVYTKAMTKELLKREDCELDLFYQSRNRCDRIHEQFENVRHVPLSNTLFHLRSIFRFPKLPSLFFQEKPDLIWMPDRRPFYSTDVPICTTIHDAVPERFAHTSSLKSKLWHKLFNLSRLEKLSSGFLFPTHSVATEINPNIPFAVTFEGSQLCEDSEKPELELNSDYFLCISSSDPRKRIDWIIQAAKDNPKLNFVIAGIKKDDPRFPKMDFIQLKNLQWVSEFSEAEKRYLLEHAKALLALSEYEGFDLPILEAIAANCPVIMSDIAVHRELYEEAIFIKNYEQLQGALNKPVRIPVTKRAYRWDLAAEEALLFFHRIVMDEDRDTGRNGNSDDHSQDS